MELLTLDFETYYGDDYTLSKMTTEQYVRDERFETIGVGFEHRGVASWYEHGGFQQLCKRVDWSRTAVLAHHAHFDGLILHHHYGVKPAFWFDTLSMGRALHGTEVGNSLAKLAQHYGVGTKGNEVVHAKGKRRADFDEWPLYGQYCVNDCHLTREIFLKMLPHFPRAELELIDLTVRMFTEPVLLLDDASMGAYLIRERQRKAELLDRINADKSQLMSNDKFALLLASMGVTPPRKESPTAVNEDGTPKRTWAFAKTDPGMKELLTHDDADVVAVVEARVGVKSTINQTRTERLLKMSSGGRALPVYLKFSGAHTHRLSGGDKLNWQNFRRTSKGSDVGTIRNSIIAPPGHKIVVCDSAQIEARTLAWFARQMDLVGAFRQGRDVYSEFATEAYGRLVDRKKNPDDFIPGFVGKTCVLGLGFQMGGPKFAATMLQGAMGGPPVRFTKQDLVNLGIDPAPFLNNPKKVAQALELVHSMSDHEKLIHCLVADAFVTKYRKRSPQIVALWGFMGEVVEWMAEGREAEFGHLGVMRTAHEKLILPNSMTLRYPELRRDSKGEWTYYAGRGRTKIYGGKLTENVIQALARIVVFEQKLKISKTQRVVMSTHDEIVTCVSGARAAESLSEMLEIMKVPPSWAVGLPLAAEGGFGDRYGEIK